MHSWPLQYCPLPTPIPPTNPQAWYFVSCSIGQSWKACCVVVVVAAAAAAAATAVAVGGGGWISQSERMETRKHWVNKEKALRRPDATATQE